MVNEEAAPTSEPVGVPTESVGKEKIGEITHYFDKIAVAIIKLDKPLKRGATIKIKGATTDLEQIVDSLQIDRADIEQGEVGQEVGTKVSDKVREGDEVFIA